MGGALQAQMPEVGECLWVPKRGWLEQRPEAFVKALDSKSLEGFEKRRPGASLVAPVLTVSVRRPRQKQGDRLEGGGSTGTR